MSDLFDPFSSISDECIVSLSETKLIETIQLWLGDVCPESPNGIGDDCAVTDISGEEPYLLTTVDGVAWGEHFNHTVSAKLAGRKLLARNLSDIASMGGTPRRAVITLWMGRNTKTLWLQHFYQGIADLAREFGVEIVGGDVSRAPEGVFISDLCLQGMTSHPVERKQVDMGDTIWVTGRLGGSILGKHTSFVPRIAEGKWLNDSGWAKSMMDISDGLAKDLGSLVGRHRVQVSELPVSDDARKLSMGSGKDAMEHALCDGEDYELVFIVDGSKDGHQLMEAWRDMFSVDLTQIGTVGETRDEFELFLSSSTTATGELFEKKGYEHF